MKVIYTNKGINERNVVINATYGQSSSAAISGWTGEKDQSLL